MRRVIRKRIRRKEDGLDLAIDFNADIVINTGATGTDDGDEGEDDPGDPAREEGIHQEREDP